MIEGASKVMLKSADARYESGLPYWMTKFSISTGMEPQLPWELCLFGARWKHDAGREGAETLQRRIMETFSGEFFNQLTVDAMLSPQCLICGKELTDPASMARFIGPECAGTSSLRVPWLFGAAQAHLREEISHA
jgi:hypothetical protein